MSRIQSDHVALANDMATHFPDQPDLVSTFLEMLAQQRALRLAGKILPARPSREFSGREDYDNRKDDWTIR